MFQSTKRNLFDFFRSAFFIFSQEKRSEVNQSHPDWRIGQVAQELGRQWKAITPELKKKYEDLAVEEKRRYEMVYKKNFVFLVL